MALAIAGCVLSTASAVDSELHVAQKLGMSEEGAMKLDLGLGLAGAACSGGASIGAGASAASSSTKIAEAGKVAARGAQIGSGAASVIGGAAALEAAKYDKRVEDRIIDALAARKKTEELERLASWLVDQLRDIEKSGRRTLDACREVIQADVQTRLTAANAVRA